jgi:hypothetical protein
VTKALLLALLGMFRSPAQACMTRHAPENIEAAAEAAEAFGVPPGLLLAVGYLETHWGCSRASGGNWGAPISRARRTVPGRAHHAASALARARRVCGGRTWRRAVMMFRTGRCEFEESRMIGYTPTEALSLARRVYLRAGIAPPADL